MATKRTACEEAADILLDDYIPALTHKTENERRKPRIELQGRLRAEGRELKRLRKAVVNLFGQDVKLARIAYSVLRDEAARIQKARTKK